ncbi:MULTISPECIES: RluA family pseudouridine synthase [unclassified Moraxella]|uniref:RluA family pseudouridine synthase n=1 Tax=unclassified Moraxella TaxID=2685852 RepID=UPI003AF96F02
MQYAPTDTATDTSDMIDEIIDETDEEDNLSLDESNNDNTCPTYQRQYVVNEGDFGERIDKIATQAFADFSREQIKTWLDTGELTVNGKAEKPKYRLKQGDVLELNATPAEAQQDLPENIPLDIVYEDDAVLVINKPVGMVVHAGAGNWSGTLVNALLYHYPNSRTLPRAGLVHRIDKETSGLLIIAKDSQSQLHLINQLKDKSVYRHYQALVLATPSELIKHRTIEAPIGRHPTQRTKMAVVGNGKPAVTHIDNIEAICEGVCLVSVRLETGRTHQIRVHLSHLGFSLLGDPVYGNARKMAILLKQLDDEPKAIVQQFQRQALHAFELGFIHPKTGENIAVKAPLPHDMQQLIEVLQ